MMMPISDRDTTTRRPRRTSKPKPTYEEKFAAIQQCIDAVRAGAEYHQNDLAFALRSMSEPVTIKWALNSYGMCGEENLEAAN